MTFRNITIALLMCVLTACATGSPQPFLIARESARSAIGPHAAQVTIVLMENKDYNRVAGSSDAPYSSEPNYLALFSGSAQGITGDRCPVYFSAPNIASELIAAGKSFAGYSESMPRDGYKGCYAGLYDRNHNPWVEFRNVPRADNLVYHGWPSTVATFVWITPNLCHDMHDCSVRIGDKWLSDNLPPIIAWDRVNDGLLIVTWDEAAPDNSGNNHIATVLVGPMIAAGRHDVQEINHYSVSRTIEKIFRLPCTAKDCSAPLIKGIWQ